MKVQRVVVQGDGISWFFYCPACKGVHRFSVGRPTGRPNWSFNGDESKPTFSPSLLMYYTDQETKERKTICHLFVRNGRIEYCGDCPHDHAGKTIDMVDIPPEDVI